MPWEDKIISEGLTFGKFLLYLWADSKSVLCNGLRGSVMAARNFHKVEDHVRLWRPQGHLYSNASTKRCLDNAKITMKTCSLYGAFVQQ